MNNVIIARRIFKIRIDKGTFPLSFEVIGIIRAAPNHPAERLTNRSEIVFNQTNIHPDISERSVT